MGRNAAERRKEPRFPIKARVLVHKTDGGTIPATAADISSSGMLLCVEHPSAFVIDEVVSVEVELPNDAPDSFSAWGLGKVVRADGCRFGIQLYAGAFESGNWTRV